MLEKFRIGEVVELDGVSFEIKTEEDVAKVFVALNSLTEMLEGTYIRAGKWYGR